MSAARGASCPHQPVARPLIVAVRTITKGCLIVVSIRTSLMTSGVEHNFMCLIYHLYIFLWCVCSIPLPVFVFVVGLFVFLILSFRGSWSIPEAGPLSDGGFADIFSQLVAFYSLNNVVQRPGVYILMTVRLVSFVFLAEYAFYVVVCEPHGPGPRPPRFLPVVVVSGSVLGPISVNFYIGCKV